MSLERMDDFFAARAAGYDRHMLNEVEGCAEGYQKMARLLPSNIRELLDLGCGTGLELDEIFKVNPLVRVTGIDLTLAMLDKLKQKYPEKDLNLIHDDYFDYEFGREKYDAAISFQTMHHFSHEAKIKLYKKIYTALKSGAPYIECDYMVINQADEDFFYRENERIRAEQGIDDDETYHYDTPCTVENQLKMLSNAGFQEVKFCWRSGNTTLIIAQKKSSF